MCEIEVHMLLSDSGLFKFYARLSYGTTTVKRFWAHEIGTFWDLREKRWDLFVNKNATWEPSTLVDYDLSFLKLELIATLNFFGSLCCLWNLWNDGGPESDQSLNERVYDLLDAVDGHSCSWFEIIVMRKWEKIRLRQVWQLEDVIGRLDLRFSAGVLAKKVNVFKWVSWLALDLMKKISCAWDLLWMTMRRFQNLNTFDDP